MTLDIKRPERPFYYSGFLIAVVIMTRFSIGWSELWLLVGGLLGAYLWEYEPEIEKILKQPPRKSLLRNVFTQMALALGTFYAVSSASSVSGVGLAYGLFSRSVVEQVLVSSAGGDLTGWFWLVKGKTKKKVIKIYLTVMILLAVIFSLWLRQV